MGLAASPGAEKVVRVSAGDRPSLASTTGDAASPMEHSAPQMEAVPPDMHFHSHVSKGEPPNMGSRLLSGGAISLNQQAPPRRVLHLPDKHAVKVSPATSGTTQACPTARSLFCDSA